MPAIQAHAVAALALYALRCAANSTRALAADISVGAQSRYITEGRDNLARGGLVTAEAGGTWRALSAGLWLGVADSTAYREINASLSATRQWLGSEWTLAWTRLWFEPDDSTDREWSLAWRAPLASRWEASAVAVQSVVADGVFVELSLSRGLWQANGQRLSAVLTQGADFGYATPQYDGLNHNGLGLRYVNRLASGWQLGLAVDHNRGGPDVRRSGGGDVTWLSVSLSR
ncbi:hypothetical protein [Abyssibacter profundi]|uniref:DUF2490 domain-containing protein n=1 Tax=Abyssibacter profundi TaxID=2182787 RepID=A0A363UMH1_9GAMM|nr:hypothetical protein [Abyssibacter profundi]PWN56619.1 hypothetical protein DEH80_07330 [Abyssibacter profundi]